APYHHLFEWGTCSLFVAIGRIEPRVTVGEDGQPTVRRMMDLRIALDERIADGYYDARSLERFTEYLTHPGLLVAGGAAKDGDGGVTKEPSPCHTSQGSDGEGGAA
ncbi:MAG: 2-oxo acid dehydrogenase subunit E2, partial [Propionibacteriaceae bacterium]|nr:2-oxo acid dehydrogenase subunit E2 [Propionibacteriaceae bacterium]